MNLIRDGGFESGLVDRWTKYGTPTFTVQSTTVKYGTYAAKILATAAAYQGAMNNDFIEVSAGELYSLSAWIHGHTDRYTYARVDRYTDNLDLIASDSLEARKGIASWQELYAEYVVEPETAYIQAGLVTNFGASGQIAYYDNVLLRLFDISKVCFLERTIAEFENLVATASSMANKVSLRGFTSYFADLDCNSLTGTTPLLDVVVYGRDAWDNTITLGTFAQLSSSGHERITLTGCTGREMWVVGTKGGTWTDCDFKVSVTGRR